MLFDNLFGLMTTDLTVAVLGGLLGVFSAITTGYVVWQVRRERGSDCVALRPDFY